MALKSIKNIILPVLFAVTAVFSMSTNAAITELTDPLSLDNALTEERTYGPNTAFVDNFEFTIASDVTALTALSVNAVGAPLVNIENFSAYLYDASSGLVLESGNGADSYSFVLNGPFSTTDSYGLSISGIVSGTIFGGYAFEIVGYDSVISAVPLPAAAWLFISGFLAIGGMSYLKRKREEKESFPSSALAA